MELSADEIANRERYGYSVGESVVALYEDFASAREHGGVCDVALRDVGICAVERVAQLCGALIDAGADRITLCDRDLAGDEALSIALGNARIDEQRIVLQQLH